MLEPLIRSDLADDVELSLRGAILTGSLAAGQRLVLDDLATMLGVSRAPVRDALMSLESDGLVAPAGRRGKVVTVLGAQDAWEVYSLRATLEAMAVRLAMQGGQPWLSELDDLVRAMREAVPTGSKEQFSALDVEFHAAICRASRHKRLFRSWEGISTQIRLLSQRVVATQYPDLKVVADRHADLLRIFHRGDPEAAEHALRDHIDTVSRRLVGVLQHPANHEPGGAR